MRIRGEFVGAIRGLVTGVCDAHDVFFCVRGKVAAHSRRTEAVVFGTRRLRGRCDGHACARAMLASMESWLAWWQLSCLVPYDVKRRRYSALHGSMLAYDLFQCSCCCATHMNVTR